MIENKISVKGRTVAAVCPFCRISQVSVIEAKAVLEMQKHEEGRAVRRGISRRRNCLKDENGEARWGG